VRPGESLRLAAGGRRRRASLMRTIGLLLVLVCATSLSGTAQDVGDSAAATAVRALEGERVKVQSRNDNHGLDLIFDNALVYIEYGEVMTKGDYLSRVKSAKPHLQQIVLEAMTVRSVENTAIVVGTYLKTDVKDGKSSMKRSRFVDTWVNKKGSWMLVAAAAVPLSK
jgi:hypothetical protein